MPRTKNGGFIIDDSNLNPYSKEGLTRPAKKTATKKQATKKTGTKKKNAR